jgi:hypothetical protein
MKRRLLAELGQPTILTPVAGPEYNLRMKGRGDVTHGVRRSARSRNSVRNSARSTKPSASCVPALSAGCRNPDGRGGSATGRRQLQAVGIEPGRREVRLRELRSWEPPDAGSEHIVPVRLAGSRVGLEPGSRRTSRASSISSRTAKGESSLVRHFHQPRIAGAYTFSSEATAVSTPC